MEQSTDFLSVLDPAKSLKSFVPLTLITNANTPAASPQTILSPSPYWGDQFIWNARANVHNPMMDQDGRVWFTTTIRPPQNPDFCQAGSSLPAAQVFPLTQSGRQLAVYDPKTGQQLAVDTCFGTDHLMFAWDSSNRLWLSGNNAPSGGPQVGWVDTNKFLQTHDSAASQGWTPIVLDTVGDGVRHDFTNPGEAPDPTKDQRLDVNPYVIVPARDGSVWFSCTSCEFRGRLFA